MTSIKYSFEQERRQPERQHDMIFHSLFNCVLYNIKRSSRSYITSKVKSVAVNMPPLEMLNFLLQMLSKTSVNEVFMHHFEKNVSFWGFTIRPPPGSCPWTVLETFVLQTLLLPTLVEKNPAGAHAGHWNNKSRVFLFRNSNILYSVFVSC